MGENRENQRYELDSTIPATKKETGYSLYVFTFVGLALLTLIAVGLTQIRVSPAITVGLVLLIATIQATIVLFYNMHLKFHDKVLIIFVGIIFTLIFLTIIITLVDYIYR